MFLKPLAILTFFFVFPFVVKGQEKYLYINAQGSLCNSSFYLFNDKKYVFERGCEQYSFMNYGNWQLRNDTLTLTQLDNKSFDIVDTIMFSGSDPTAPLKIMVLDKNAVDITEDVWVCLRSDGVEDIYLYEIPDLTKLTNRQGGKIAIRTLERLVGRDIEFPVTDATNYTVKLAVSREYIHNEYSQWFDLGVRQFVRINGMFISIPKGEDKDPLQYLRSPK